MLTSTVLLTPHPTLPLRLSTSAMTSSPLLLLVVLCLLSLTVSASSYTFTPKPQAHAAGLSLPSHNSGRHLTFALSSHHSIASTSSSSSSSFHPLSRFSTYQLAESNITGCANVDFSAAVYLDGQGPFRLIVDSGSTTLAVASNLCINCSGVHPTYTGTPSKLAYGGRTVQSRYGGGTGWSGHAYTSAVSLNGSPACAINIASIEVNDGFINSVSCTLGEALTVSNYSQGIMGFGRLSTATSCALVCYHMRPRY